MSSPVALAVVTATLKDLLKDVVDNEDRVTTMSPSVARSEITADQINIFLYGIHYHSAFSNFPMPGNTKGGESAHPPLALVLKYLITAYGASDNDISGQEVMGNAMSILHDHPVLERRLLESINADSGLHQQIEQLKITQDDLSLDDMSKLWTSFQSAEYRLSTGYEISVVLIESTRAAKTPLPVLKRGENDQGINALADLIPPYPAFCEVILPNQQLSALPGNIVTINGNHLAGDTVVVHFKNSRLTATIEVPISDGGTADQITVQIPNDPANWVVGFYSIDATISKAGEQDRTTNILPLPLAPQILEINPANPVVRDSSGNVTLTISCSPEIRPEQRVALLLGDREVLSQPHSVQTDTLQFQIEDAPSGNRFIRLRVDGVDSLLVDHNVTPPEFKADMEVTFT